MVYVLIGLAVLLAAAVVVIAVLCVKMRKKDGGAEEAQEALAPGEEDGSLPAKARAEQPLIKIEPLSLDTLSDEDERNMQEITDSSLLARIDQLIPGLAQATVSGVTAGMIAKADKAAEAARATEAARVAEAVKEAAAIKDAEARGEIFCKAIIPTGLQLDKSSAVEGALRGTCRGENGKIAGQASFIPLDTAKKVEAANKVEPVQPVKKHGGLIAANVFSTVMSVASAIVGQYYMSQIDGKLENVNKGLSEISNFQDNEFKGEVDALLTLIRTLTTFNAEILENEELRDSKIAQLNNMEMKCMKLLSQANVTLQGYTKQTNLNFDEYKSKVEKAQQWFEYQRYLFIMLCQIANLEFTLYKGAISREQCAANVIEYSEKTQAVGGALREWHTANVKRLNISIRKGTVKRVGLDRAVHFVPGLFNEESNSKKIDDKLVRKIVEQSAEEIAQERPDTSNLYAEDVQIVARGGKLYYLPAQSA